MRHYLVARQIVASLLFAIATLALVGTVSDNVYSAEPARLMTFQQDGQTYYALSLLPPADQQPSNASSIVVLFDTSASQQGAYREKAMNSLQALLDNLRPSDRVELMAVDLGVKPLTNAPAAPTSDEVAQGFAALAQQIPLGSTDLAGALEAATARLQQFEGGQRTIVYIGDGISVANLLDTNELTQVVTKLREARVAVSSYAVGPKLDAQMLAVLANQTGGNLYVQAPMVWQQASEGITDAKALAENTRKSGIAGRTIAKWTTATVLWPEQVELASELGKTYPAMMPPLRTDRDTIILGVTGDTLPAAVSASMRTGSVAGTSNLSWTASTEASAEDHAFLAEIVKGANADDGLSLPTIGTVGLMETARLVGARMDQLTKLAERAVALGDHETAQRIADAVLQSDPGNAQARTVQLVIEQAGPADQLGGAIFVEPPVQAGVPTPAAAPVNGDIVLVQPAPSEPVPSGAIVYEAPPVAGGLLDEIADGGELLDRVEQERRVFVEMLRKDIQNTLIDARAQMALNPEVAIQDLKLALESVQRVADIDASKRAELVSKLRSALKEAHYQASRKDELDRQREEELASSRAQKLINDRLSRSIEREKQLMDRFNSLVDERRYIEAQEVAQIVEEIDPNGVTPRVATHWARFKRHEYLMSAARTARNQAAWDAWYQIELSHIPFPDVPPIVYPDASVWEELTNRRKRWASVDLSAQSKAEERIQAALRETLSTALSYDAEPLNFIMEAIADEYEIPIVFDQSALDEVAISPESEVTVNLRNVSLRSALNIMFKTPGLEDLTYVIDDEVLLITTEDEANATLKVKVYPVADLVLPVETPQLIGGGGGGGGGLGGGGGGQGGGGGGGFGGGGGGQGGGGGGGFFNVADDIEADQPASQVSARAQSNGQAAATKSTEVEWQARFANEQVDPDQVRRQVRQLMTQKEPGQAVKLIQAALQHGQAQSWMYESLGIAMELDGRPKSDIERAVMSACDFSNSPEELMLIANYLAHIGIDSRAVEVYRQVVKVAPLNHEAYALGLRAAQRAKDLEGVRWATVGVLSNDLPKQHRAITDTARRVAKSILDDLKAAGKDADYDSYYQELERALARDVVIKATWSGDADVDLIVEEPGGSVCSLHEPRTTGGGVSLGDDYSSYNKDSSDGYQEQYSCAQGFPGTYRVRVRKVWGDVVADKVTIEVYKNYGSKNQQYEKQRISVKDDSDALVVFEVDQARRDQPLAAEKLQVAVNRQDAVNQAVLAQQLAGASDPNAVPIRGNSPGDDLRDRLALAGRGGAVGFQPIIQTLPSGTQMQVTGVVSSDRRYVRIAASPSFTGVGDVTTFSFSGQAGGGLGGGGGGAGGGLGGGGGGGI